MADYKIRIVTTADNSALQQTGKELGKSTDAVKKLGDEQKKTEDKTKSFAKENKNLLDGFKKLSHEVPLAGAAISALKNPFTALAFAIGLIVAKFREFSSAIDDAASKVQGLDGFTNRIRVFSEIMAGVRSQRNAVAEKLNEIKDAASTAEGKMKLMNEQLERTLRLEGNEDTANKANAIAGIKAKVQSGAITPEQGIRAEAQINTAFERRALDRENRRAAGAVANQFNAITATREEIAGAQGRLPGAEAAFTDAAIGARVAQNKEQALKDAGVIVGGKSFTLGEATAERNKLKQQGFFETSRFGNIRGAFSGGRRIGDIKREARESRLASFEQAITGYQTAIDQQAGLTVAAQGRLTGAQGRLSGINDTITGGQQRLVNLQGQFTNTVGALNQEQASRGRVAGVEGQTAGINVGIELQKNIAEEQGKLIETFRRMLSELGRQNLTAEQMELMAKQAAREYSTKKTQMQSQ